MGLIMGSWMMLMQGYQALSLKLIQQEHKRAKLRSEWSASELSSVGKAVSGESSRMSSGSSTVHAPSQSNAQIKRRSVF